MSCLGKVTMTLKDWRLWQSDRNYYESSEQKSETGSEFKTEKTSR